MNSKSVVGLALAAVVSAGCGENDVHTNPGRTGAGGGGSQDNPPAMTPSGGGGGGQTAPMDPLPPVATGIVVSPEYASTYSIFDLGPLPIPEAQGFLVANNDRDALLVSTWFSGSHAPEEGLYRVGVKRDSKGHIYEINTTSQLVVPSVEVLGLTNGPGGQIFATSNEVTPTSSPLSFFQFGPGLTNFQQGTVPVSSEVALDFAFVPAPLAGAGGTRFTTVHNELDPMTGLMKTITSWYVLGPSYSSGTATFSSATLSRQIDGELGGMAYVPAGSPGFPSSALMMGSGWGVLPSQGLERAWAFDIDTQGMPYVGQKHAFLQATDPAGVPFLNALQFEPTTGDFLFLYGGRHVFQVRGFVPPMIN